MLNDKHTHLISKTNNSLARVSLELFGVSGELKCHVYSNFKTEFQNDITFENYDGYKSNELKDVYRLNDDECYISIVDDFENEINNNNFTNNESIIIKRLMDNSLFSCLRMSLIYKGSVIGFLYFNSKEKGFFRTGDRLDFFRESLEEIRIEVISYVESIKKLSLICDSYKKALEAKYYNISSDDGKINNIKNIVEYLISKNKNRLNIDNKSSYEIVEFSPLHDIGKIAIPDNILFKSGKLNEDEFKVIKNHPQLGWDIIESTVNNSGVEDSCKDIIRNIILCHHEKLNGTGYPKGLSGDDIPIEAKIVTVADIYDALTTKRVYKKKCTHKEAMNILHEMANNNEVDKDLVVSLNGYA